MLKEQWQIIGLLCIISSLARFVFDSFLPSLFYIGDHFNLSSTLLQSTLTVYLFSFGISQLFYGPLSDHYGRRKILLIGLCIFLIGNIICATAISSHTLFLGRFLAGMGAGVCGVLNRAICSDCFHGADFSKAWSYTTSALVVTLGFAPLLGGYVQELYGWRINFFMAAFYVGACLLIIFKFLPETNQKKSISPIHKNLYSLKKTFNNYAKVLSSQVFMISALCYTFAFSGLIIYFQTTAILYVRDFGLSPSEYGWYSMIIAGNYLIGGMIVTKLAKKIGIHQLLVFGTLLLILGGLLMLLAWLLDYKNIIATLVTASIYVLGARIVIPNAIAGSLKELRHLGGTSSAALGCIQILGSCVVSILTAQIGQPSMLSLGAFLTVLGLMTFGASAFVKR